MTEIESLYQKANQLLKDFSSLEIVSRYHFLKNALKEDSHLQEIKKTREDFQSKLKYISSEKKDEVLSLCKRLDIEYRNDPLVINLLSTKEEIDEIIKPLTETKL